MDKDTALAFSRAVSGAAGSLLGRLSLSYGYPRICGKNEKRPFQQCLSSAAQ